MIEINLKTVFVSYDRIAMRWSLSEPVFEPITFEVWRSGTTTTGFEKVGETLSTVYQDRHNMLAKYKPTYYKIRAVVNGNTVESNVAAYQNESNEEVARLQKRERFQLAKYDGIPAFVYPRRRTGKKCPRCVGDKMMGNLGNQCQLCFDTGFLKGYYPPIPIYIARTSLDGAGANIQENYVKEASSDNFWTSNYTDIEPEDVVIEMVPPNNIYRVTGVQTSERRRASVRQIITANEADKGVSLHYLPIPDFPWPDRSEIYWGDWSDPPQDFDTIFFERLDAYVKHQDLRDQADNAAHPPQAEDTHGKRNPAKGYYA